MSLKEKFFSTDSKETPEELGEGSKAKGVIFLETREEEIIGLLEEVSEKLSRLERRLTEVEKSADLARRRTKKELKDLEEKLNERHSRTFNSLQEVRSTTQHFQNELEKLNERSKDRDELVESLQERTRRLQKEFLFSNLIGDGAQELINLRDAVLERRGGCEDPREEEFLSQLEDRLLEALEEFEIREVSEDGEEFDPQLQEVVKKVPVKTAGKADSVVEVLEPGYKWEDKVIRAQQVAIGKLSHGGEDNER